MPGFGSFDDLINEASTNGKTFRQDWNKNMLPTTPAVAGEWSFLARGGGNPGADALFNTGTNLTFQTVSNSTANASSIPIGPAVLSDYKYILNATAFSAAATTMPAVAMLVDLVGFYRVTTTTTITSQALTNSITSTTNTITSVDASGDFVDHTFYALQPFTRVQLTTTTTLPGGLSLATDYFIIKVSDTRCKFATSYANAVAGTAVNITDAGTGTHTINTLLPRWTNGAGVQAFMWANNATPLGAGTPNLSFPAYTNSEQTGSRATPAVLPVGKTAAANGLILYSGTGAGKYGPFMPLQSGDSGVAKVDNVQLSSTYTSGEFSIGLCKPILTLPMTTVGIAAEREFISKGIAPRIYDGAALYWLLYHGAATPVNSAFYGHIDYVWG